MESSSLLTTSVIVILSLVTLQGLVLVVTILALGKKIASLQEHTGKLGTQVNDLLDQGDRLLAQAETLSAKVPNQLEKVANWLKWTTEKIDEVDHYAEQNLQGLRSQVEGISQKSDDLLSGFSVATFRIHRAVINPTRHIAAALSAIQESVVWYFARGKKEPEPTYPDEQIFI